MKKLFVFFQAAVFVLFFCTVFACAKTGGSPTDSIDYKQLDDAFAQAERLENLKSLTVSQNGRLIKEAYYHGGSDNIPGDVRSVTKSVIALLIGIAVEKGFIHSIDDPIRTYLSSLVPDFPVDKQSITIRHLLTMSSGIEWYESGAVGFNSWVTAPNQVDYVLEKPMSAQPGQTFNYNSGALHLLSVIITQASGMPTLDFANRYLFSPLDIADTEWSKDKQGFYNGGAGLQITPRNMIKIGDLILQQGKWNTERIVSAQWITLMTSSNISVGNSMSFAEGYGFCWWTGECPQGAYSFANGYGGQFIVIVPSLHLVVTATNRWTNLPPGIASSQWYETLDLIISSVITSF